MRQPRAPFMTGGSLNRVWRDYLTTKSALPAPEGPPEGRAWVEYWRRLGAVRLPRDPVTDAGGYLTRPWRDLIETL